MASAPASSVGSVVVDANVLIAICAREKAKFNKAETALKDFAAKGSVFYAPGLIIGEVLYVLCGKLQNGLLTAAEHDKAVRSFQAQMNAILPPPRGDAALVTKSRRDTKRLRMQSFGRQCLPGSGGRVDTVRRHRTLDLRRRPPKASGQERSFCQDELIAFLVTND